MQRTIFGTLTTNTQTEPMNIRNTGTTAEGAMVHVSGTFGAGTATVEFKAADGVWRALSNGAFTVAADKVVTVANNTEIRLSLTGSTGANIYWQIANMYLNTI